MSLADEFRSHADKWHSDVATRLMATLVHYDIVDETRWGHVVEYVYQRGDEYARVEYEEGSGDSDIDYDPVWTAVRPVTKTIVTYTDLD